jgi:hypothetical protein
MPEFETHAGGAVVQAQERVAAAVPVPPLPATLTEPLAKRKQDILERKQSILQVADSFFSMLSRFSIL